MLKTHTHSLYSRSSILYNENTEISSAVGTPLCVFGARMAGASRSAQELRKPFPAWYGEQRTSTQQLWCAYHADGQGAWLGRAASFGRLSGVEAGVRENLIIRGSLAYWEEYRIFKSERML